MHKKLLALACFLATALAVSTASAQTVDVRVDESNDDAEERQNGSVALTSSDLELVDDGSKGKRGQTIGIRFKGITIPPGATIGNAYILFTVDEKDSGPTSVTVYGQAASNPPTFSKARFDITSRPRTPTAVDWPDIPPWNVVGVAEMVQQTPDLFAIVQEIIDDREWASGNSMVFIIEGSGERTAESFNGVAASAPLLHVEYTLNWAPVLGSIGPQTAVEDELSNVGVSATHPAGDPVVLLVSGLPASFAMFATFRDNGDGTGTLDLAPSSGDAGVYQITVTASDGELTDKETFELTVIAVSSPPVITDHPVDQTVVEDRTATFGIAAAGPSPLGYQWRADGVDVAGATGPSYTTPQTTPADDRTGYSALVTNAYGSVESDEATLSVRPDADIVIDEGNRRWLYHENGRPFFVCGPGEPEDFLYQGSRNPDGTRDGDQMALIGRLAGTGANGIAVQIIRSHGGGGDPNHNPFVDSDPALGLDGAILDQWETWFTVLEEAGIAIFMVFFDDGAGIWGGGDTAPPEERAFLEAIVNRFEPRVLPTSISHHNPP